MKVGVECKYLIVNDSDRNYGLWVNTVGYQPIPPNSPYPLREHPTGYFFNAAKGRILREYQFVYIMKGQGMLSTESTAEIPIDKGCLILLYPGQWHTYHPLKYTGWDEYYIGFEGPLIDSIFSDSFFSKDQQVLEVGVNEELVSLFNKAIQVARADKTAAQQYLSGIVMHIIGMVISISKNKSFELSEADQKIEQAKILMNRQVDISFNPEQLAHQLNVGYSWFRKVFKEYTGYSPLQYFQELKLREAKHLLVCSSKTVKEIAYLVGYQSAEHFYSFFKKRTGFTPLAYRLSVRKPGIEI
ncbi:MAG: AraC family transcriptional regulator [Parabacteroides sp.]|nr:AraC family transcriptional regulator [Bacteroidaceae bacterium]